MPLPGIMTSTSWTSHRTNELVQSHLDEVTASVLFGLNSSTRPFPLSKVTFLHAKRSPWGLVIARYAIEARRSELIRQGIGQNLRPMYFKDIEWGNHFVRCAVDSANPYN